MHTARLKEEKKDRARRSPEGHGTPSHEQIIAERISEKKKREGGKK